MNPFVRNCYRVATVKRALKVALVIGPILVFINHHDEIMHLRFSLGFFLKSFLTFLVPYLVSTYSSAQAYLEEERKKSKESFLLNFF